jgi:transposase, IS5 family
MRTIGELAGAAGTKLRDRTTSTRNCLINIGRASRSRVKQGKERMQQSYGKLLSITGRVLGQAKRFAQEAASGVKRSACVIAQAGIEAERKYLQTMIPRVQQVMRQTRERIFKGNPHSRGKLVSLIEAHTEIIRKGKASKPTEFGKMVKIQEAEHHIVTHYEVYDQRPCDSDLLVPALEVHEQQFARPPRLVAADAGFFSAHNEAAARARGVKRVSIPNRSNKSAERKKHQKLRWFRNGLKWRTGAEGRIRRLEETTRARSMSLPGTLRHQALGRARRHRRQPDQYRPGSCSCSQALKPAVPSSFPTPPK